MTSTIRAAGTLCWREVDGDVHVLLVRRGRHGDVSLPKGKVEPGEALPQTAVRETAEETGLEVTLGVPLGSTAYTVPGGEAKVVRYWAAEVSDEAVSGSRFRPGEEVESVEWVPLTEARKLLSYRDDVTILDRFAAHADRGIFGTFALIPLRHGAAMGANDWDGSDADRPLVTRGKKQAGALAPIISAWRPRKLLSSGARRCVQTVTPLSEALGLPIKLTDNISADAYEVGAADIGRVIRKRIKVRETAVLCSHNPVLASIVRRILEETASVGGVDRGLPGVGRPGTTNAATSFAAVDSLDPASEFDPLDPGSAYPLDPSSRFDSLDPGFAFEPASFWVVHVSSGNPSLGVVAIERYTSGT